MNFSKKIILFLILLNNIKISFGAEIAKSLLNETTESSKIVALSMAAATTFGIINAQIAARICPEYFTEGFHKQIVENLPHDNPLRKILLSTKSSTVIGFHWGIVAALRIVAILGIPAIASARLGNLPKLNYKDLIKPTSIGMLGMFIATFLAGLKGNSYAANCTPDYLKSLYPKHTNGVPLEAMRGWVTNDYAHSAVYGSGALMALGLTIYNILKRYSL